MRPPRLATALALLLLLAPACATFGTPPGQAPATEAARAAEVSIIVNRVETVVSLVKAAQASEITLYHTQAVPIAAETHATIQEACRTFARTAKPAVARLGDVASQDADRKVAAAAVFDGAKDVLAEFGKGGPAVESWAVALRAVLTAAGVL